MVNQELPVFASHLRGLGADSTWDLGICSAFAKGAFPTEPTLAAQLAFLLRLYEDFQLCWQLLQKSHSLSNRLLPL